LVRQPAKATKSDSANRVVKVPSPHPELLL